jgi:hypothetical protein
LSTVEMSFGQIEAVCARLNRIASDKRVAFMGRLKQLQKHNIIERTRRPGKGKPGTYSFTDLMRFVIAVELMQCGLMPKMAADLVTGSWELLRYSVYSATHTREEMDEWMEMPHGPETADWFWMLTPEAMREISQDGLGEWDHMEAINAVPFEEVAEQLRGDREIGAYGESWRTIALHGTMITQAVINIVEDEFRYADRKQIREDLMEEVRAMDRMFEEDPIGGVEEAIVNRFENIRNQTIKAMEDKARRARYKPTPPAMKRQAHKQIDQLRRREPHLLAYIIQEDLNGQDTADLKAMNSAMMHGLVVPDLESDKLVLKLSPLGRSVKLIAMNVLRIEVSPTAIEDWRAECHGKIEDAVKRKIDALLKSDPDYPEDDEALQRWARHGGKLPITAAKGKENARRIVAGIREATKDDPEMWEEFQETLRRIEARRNGDDQKA